MAFHLHAIHNPAAMHTQEGIQASGHLLGFREGAALLLLGKVPKPALSHQVALPGPLPEAPRAHGSPGHLVGRPAAREEVAVVVAVQRDVEDAGVAVEGLLGPIPMVHVLRGSADSGPGVPGPLPGRRTSTPARPLTAQGSRDKEEEARGRVRVPSTRADRRLRQ